MFLKYLFLEFSLILQVLQGLFEEINSKTI